MDPDYELTQQFVIKFFANMKIKSNIKGIRKKADYQGYRIFLARLLGFNYNMRMRYDIKNG